MASGDTGNAGERLVESVVLHRYVGWQLSTRDGWETIRRVEYRYATAWVYTEEGEEPWLHSEYRTADGYMCLVRRA